MWGERQSETDQQGEIAEGGGGVGRVGPSRPSVRPSVPGGTRREPPHSRARLCPASLLLPLPRDRLGISAPCPEGERVFGSWVGDGKVRAALPVGAI